MAFYEEVFGMKVLRHEEFNQGCEATCNGPYARPWSKTMIGFASELDSFVFELTYNYGIHSYKVGSDVRHVEVVMDAKWSPPRNWPVQTLDDCVVISGPDQVIYRVRRGEGRPHIAQMSLNVSDVGRSKAFYVDTLGLVTKQPFSPHDGRITVVWRSGDETGLELVASGEKVLHEEAFGRIAFSCPNVAPIAEKMAHFSGASLKHGPVRLETPGKATVEVVILEDEDGYEICFVEATGFDALSAPMEGADVIDWNQRRDMGADKA